MQISLESKNAFAGRARNNPGPSARQFIDELITAKVRQSLVLDHQVDAAGMAVATANSTVQLHGTASSEAERSRAQQLAWAVSGVVFVRNYLRLK